MSIKPILFNTEMVRSILDGRKTQTRRVVKEFTGEVILSVRSPDGTEIGKYGRDGWRGKLPDRYDGNTYCVEAKPPCKAGDILWVRETWSTHYDGIHYLECAICHFRARSAHTTTGAVRNWDRATSIVPSKEETR